MSAIPDVRQMRDRLPKRTGPQQGEPRSKVANGRGGFITMTGKCGQMTSDSPERRYASAVIFVGEQTAEKMNFLQQSLLLIRCLLGRRIRVAVNTRSHIF